VAWWFSRLVNYRKAIVDVAVLALAVEVRAVDGFHKTAIALPADDEILRHRLAAQSFRAEKATGAAGVETSQRRHLVVGMHGDLICIICYFSRA